MSPPPDTREPMSLETLNYAVQRLELVVGDIATMIKEGLDKLERKLDERLSSRDKRMDDLEAKTARRMDKMQQDFEDFKEKEFGPIREKQISQNVKIGVLWGVGGALFLGLLGLFWQVVLRGGL